MARQVIEQVAEEVARRLQHLGGHLDAGALAEQIANINDRIDGLTAKAGRADEPDPLVTELLDRLRELGAGQVDGDALAGKISNIQDRIDALTAKVAQAGEPDPLMRELIDRLREFGPPAPAAPAPSVALQAGLAAELTELRAEQASADRRTQSRLLGLQDILEKLVARLAAIESEIAGDVDEALRPPGRAPGSGAASAANALRGLEALAPEIAPQRSALERQSLEAEESSPAPLNAQEFLIEPALAPGNARERRATLRRSLDRRPVPR